MKVIVNESGIAFGSLMKLIFVGYVIGMGLLLLPFLLLDMLGLSEMSLKVTGMVVLPLVLAVQGIVLGLCISLGLFVFRKFAGFEIKCPATMPHTPADPHADKQSD